MSEPFRERLVWPVAGTQPLKRARTMALAYRDAAAGVQARMDALRKALAAVDLRVLQYADPDVAEMVRQFVAEAAPDPVVALDLQFSEWGERWHADLPKDLAFDDDDWVPTWVAAQIVGTSTGTLGDHRGDGTIPGRYFKARKGFLYRVGDLRQVRGTLPGTPGRPDRTPVKYQ